MFLFRRVDNIPVFLPLIMTIWFLMGSFKVNKFFQQLIFYCNSFLKTWSDPRFSFKFSLADLPCFFSKSITLFSSLLLTILSSLLICWFEVANFVIVSHKFEIWSQRFRRSELTITFPLRLIICWIISAFFSALIALSDKLDGLLDVLLSTVMLINYVLTSPQRDEEQLNNRFWFASTQKNSSSPYGC